MRTTSQPKSNPVPARRTLAAVAVGCSLMGAVLALGFARVRTMLSGAGHSAPTAATNASADLLAQRSLRAGWHELGAVAAEQLPFAESAAGPSELPVVPAPGASTQPAASAASTASAASLVSAASPVSPASPDTLPRAFGVASAALDAFDAPEVPAPSAAVSALLRAQGPDVQPTSPSPPAWTPAATASEPGAICGKAVCATGQVCCNASCGTCVDPGERCDQFVCGMNASTQSEPCGPNTCNTGQVCCNVSCGTCTPPGANCDQRQCSNAIQIPLSPLCGLTTCNVGSVCCNPSCGICAPFGVPCSQRSCG